MKKQNLIFILLIMLSACKSKEEQLLDYALNSAGPNRPELEKVIEHYSQSHEDKQKLEAARFLISNMSGHFSYDSSAVRELEPFYHDFHDISERYKWKVHVYWGDEAGGAWKNYKASRAVNIIDKKVVKDAMNIKGDWLIEHIDLSFKAWQANAYTRDMPFSEFCEYILPYRIADGIIPGNSRKYYFEKEDSPDRFKNKNRDFRDDVDSLLYRYKHIIYSQTYCSDLPVLNTETVELLRIITCDNRCWFNVSLLSAQGIPVVMDAVPNWGNRHLGHTWNAVVLDGKTYPFEPFWDNDRWKYKKIYNNNSVDESWGRLRLPKVFRHTYALHPDEMQTDPSVYKGDIPESLRNYRKIDVSDAYFETTDVSLSLKDCPKGVKYAYLCVFDGKEWLPVYWGKVGRNGKTVFAKMGRNIVYLPVYNQNGKISPAAAPFLLQADGSVKHLDGNAGDTTICVRSVSGDMRYKNDSKNRSYLQDAVFLGSNSPGEFKDTLHIAPRILNLDRNKGILPQAKNYRYIRMVLPTDTFAIAELSFFGQNGRIPYKSDIASLLDVSVGRSGFECDGLSGTCLKGVFTEKGRNYIDFDLGGSVPVEYIQYSPFIESQLGDFDPIELYYWDGKWKFVEKKNGNGHYLYFKNVPANVLYLVKNRKGNKEFERPFIYEDGIVEWY